MELTGTPDQQLVFLNMHWGRMYEFTAPDRAGAPLDSPGRFRGPGRTAGELGHRDAAGSARPLRRDELPRR
jgi:hypothetical protein